MTHAIGHKPVYKPAPDIGCCTKVSAFLVGAAGTAGLMTWAFGGPIIGGAAGGVAAKVVEAVQPVPNQPGLIATAGAAFANGKLSAMFTDRYESRCTSFTQSLGCSIDGTVAIIFGIVAVVSGIAIYKIGSSG